MWIPGLVVRQMGPVSYEVREQDSDTVHRCHGDQLGAGVIAESNSGGTESQAERAHGENGTKPQGTVDSSMQPSVLLEPEPVTLRCSTPVCKPPKPGISTVNCYTH